MREIGVITLCIDHSFIRKAELLWELWDSGLIVGIRSDIVVEEAEE